MAASERRTSLTAQSGPCRGCGAENYPLSTSGPAYCPACACYPPGRRVGQLAGENRRLRELLAQHGIDPVTGVSASIGLDAIGNQDMRVEFEDDG